jgi:glycosyltransferase involved in cell wall biosynthesis
MNCLSRRVLILSYHFPPSGEVAGKPTARLVRHLSAFGWEPVVVTIPESDVTVPLDPAAYADVLQSTRVEKVARWRSAPDGLRALVRILKRRRATAAVGGNGVSAPRKQRPMAKWAISYLTYPDLQAGWVGPVVRHATRLLRRERFDALLTVAPPHSACLAGWLLHRRFPRLPWIAQMHDPWAGNPYHPPGDRLQDRLTHYLERKVLRSADAICLATDEAAAALVERYPAIRDRIHVLCNGYDPADFPNVADRPQSGPLRFVYAGSMYGCRDPFPFVRGLAAAMNGYHDDVRVEILGDFEPRKEALVRQELRELGLSNVVTILPPIPYAEALARLSAADVLLLFAQGQPDQIPAKLYEYLALDRFVLAFTDGASARLVREADAGRVVGPNDDSAAAVTDVLDMHRKGHLRKWCGNSSRLEKFQARHLAGELASLLDDCAVGRRRA